MNAQPFTSASPHTSHWLRPYSYTFHLSAVYSSFYYSASAWIFYTGLSMWGGGGITNKKIVERKQSQREEGQRRCRFGFDPALRPASTEQHILPAYPTQDWTSPVRSQDTALLHTYDLWPLTPEAGHAECSLVSQNQVFCLAGVNNEQTKLEMIVFRLPLTATDAAVLSLTLLPWAH